MSEDFCAEKKKDPKKKDKDEKYPQPWEIQGKIDVPDTRERRDGPGGN